MKNKTGKSLTYEEIGSKLKMSPQQVHKIEKDAFNKIVKRFMTIMDINIFDSMVLLSDYFGLDPDQIYKKLDDNNYQILCEYIYDEFGKEMEGFVKPEENGFKKLFV